MSYPHGFNVQDVRGCTTDGVELATAYAANRPGVPHGLRTYVYPRSAYAFGCSDSQLIEAIH